MGVVFLPSRVTGFSAMSRRQMMTFIEGRQFSANSSQRDGSFGPACRFILTMTFFVSAIHLHPSNEGMTILAGTSLRGVIPPRPRLDQRDVHRLIRELDIVIDPLGARRFQPIGVVALRKFRLIVRAARFIARQRA